MKFRELSKESVDKVEGGILKKWKEMDILNKTIEKRKDSENFVFYDGPIYANAKPGIHHVFAKSIKDAFCKYKTMKGYRVLRKIGLDTHGLPIEVNVEKKLGFKSKADIEKYGIEKFCEECKIETDSNIDEVRKLTDMMGQFIDCDHPYVTCSKEYIESEWWIVNELNKKGLIYYGSKVLPYCRRCGTELASHEVSQGYKEVSVNTVIVPFKIEGKDEYFLVWTTTPWTLMANVALCVNPTLDYVKVESKGYKFILAKDLVNSVLNDECTILETYKGSDLVGIKYEQLMPFVKVEGKSFIVLADNYVTASDGTGIVHIAPAYGEDYNRVCRENDIAFINPVGKDGKYLTGPWTGYVVTDPNLEIEIIKYLKENDKLFKKIKMTHEYPHCWRCKEPLIYYAKPAWYVRTTEYKDKIIESNKTVTWYPEFIGQKRFNNWLENMIDWGISRNRYWGCPLPIWQCDCGNFETIGSLKELKERSIEDVDIDTIELHRPYVDNIHIKCSKCDKIMNRVPDVLDVWFDSGAMPYAQMHYPFENKELFEEQFPADFIAEGVDQTRGWFYVLLVLSTLISGKSSFKRVVVNDMMLDANGKKMSKSTGNIIDPIEIMTKYGADTIRWYMPYASPIYTPLKFDIEGLKEVYSKFFNTLKNTYNFFALYANTDSLDPREFNVEYENREEIDKWLLSKYNKLISEVTDGYESYDLTKVVRKVTDFVSDDLSNWYIRRNRRRFWASDLDENKKAVYNTTYEVLLGLSKLIAPIVPYISEEIYTSLTNKESVHLEDFPICDKTKINDEIEKKMDLVKDLISLGRNAREEAKIKVRQPISEIILDAKVKNIIGDLTDLIKEELNVKSITFTEDLTKYMSFEVKPNFKICGPIFGKEIKDFANALTNLTQEDIKKMEEGSTKTINLNKNNIEITYDMLDVRISAKEGFNASHENNNFIILNITLTKELINEGIVREFISKVQQMRKTNDYEMMDRINIYYTNNDEFNNAIKDYIDFIKVETLADNLIIKDEIENKLDLNGIVVGIELEKRN